MCLSFWQKSYLAALALFLVLLDGGIFTVSAMAQRNSFEAEADVVLAHQELLVQQFAQDAAVVQAQRPAAMPRLAQMYVQRYGGQGMLVHVLQGSAVLASALPEGTPLPEAPAQGSRAHSVQRVGGVRMLCVSQCVQVGGQSFTVVCAADMEAFFVRWEGLAARFCALGAAASALFAALLYILLRRFAGPLTALSKQAKQIAAGDYSARSGVQAADEAGALARAMDEMACKTQHTVARLAAAAQEKQRLVDALAHELRTPLTAIEGYAEYIGNAELPEEERYEAVQYILSQTRRLSSMSERLLQMALVRGGQMQRGPVALARLLAAVERTVRPKAEVRGVALYVHAPPLTLLGDAALLESLFLNLADNAVKACGNGARVDICAEQTPQGVRVRVADTGCGMDEQALGRLGEAFFRADKARSRADGGAGLGLALAFAVCEAHGASLKFDSKPGAGTTAAVQFPPEAQAE